MAPFRILLGVHIPKNTQKLFESSPTVKLVFPEPYRNVPPEVPAPLKKRELLENIKKYGPFECIYVTLNCKVDEEVLDAVGPSLKVVSTVSVGFDHIDLNACAARGIRVGHTPGVLSDTTADMAVTLMLSVGRRVTEAANAIKEETWGDWTPFWMCGNDLSRSTVGIFGMGRIGQLVAKRVLAFGCRVLYSDVQRWPKVEEQLEMEYVSFDELLAQSDFVSAHCPLTPQTRDIFGTETFKKMKKTAIFINTSRGPVCNLDDLYDALTNGDINAAGLDVTVPEPLPASHPLLALPNCLITPHIASASLRTRHDMFELAARNAIAVAENRPLEREVKPIAKL